MTSRTQMPVQTETFKAAGTITKNRFVVGPAIGATQAGAAGFGLGVAQSDAVSGEFFPVLTAGVALIEAGAAIADNALLEADSSGRAITRTGTNPILGRARMLAGAAGQLIPADLFKA